MAETKKNHALISWNRSSRGNKGSSRVMLSFKHSARSHFINIQQIYILLFYRQTASIHRIQFAVSETFKIQCKICVLTHLETHIQYRVRLANRFRDELAMHYKDKLT